MSDLPSVTLVRKHPYGDFYDYVGRVNVVRNVGGSVNYINILDKDTGEQVCQLMWGYENDFVPRDGRVVKFRGKVREVFDGLIEPHIKRD